MDISIIKSLSPVPWWLAIVCRWFAAIVLAEAYFKPSRVPDEQPSPHHAGHSQTATCAVTEDSNRRNYARRLGMPAFMSCQPKVYICLLVVCLLNWKSWQRTHQHSAVYVRPQDLESRLPLTRCQEAGEKGKERLGRERSRRKVTAVAVCNCDDENQTSFISPSHSLPSSTTIFASCPSLFSLTLCSQK